MFTEYGFSDRKHTALLVQVARYYYEEGLSQAQIAKKITYSRVTVSRLIQEARQRGIVNISIEHPFERLQNLEVQLCKKFTLQDARVSDDTNPIDCARLGANYFLAKAKHNSLITLSNGSSTAAMVNQLRKQRWTESCVVQMIGSLGRYNHLEDSPEICRRMAEHLGGTYRTLPVPLVIDSAITAQSLRKEGQVAAVLELAARADVAVIGVGSVLPGTTHGILEHWHTSDIYKTILDTGAVAQLCGHHLDTNGNHLSTPLCDRTIAISPDKIKAIPLVIGIAWGIEKVPAIQAVLKGKYLNVLVTNESTARALLQL